MVKPHLYILAFNDNEHFKLGISIAPNQNRISKHISTYGVDVSKSLVVSCDDKNSIKLLEKNLKHITSKVITEDSPYYGLDGHTEIRKNEQLEEVMGVINLFKPILGLEIEALKVEEKPIKVKNERKPIKFANLYDNEKSLFVIDNRVRSLLEFITNVKVVDKGFESSSEEYLEVTIDLSSKFESAYDVFDFIEPIHSDFSLFHRVESKGRCREFRIDCSGEFRNTSGSTICSADLKEVVFSFRRYFPYRHLDLIINEDSLVTPINVIMDDYDKLMELLIDTYKNKKIEANEESIIH
jgi:hypothetical protein